MAFNAFSERATNPSNDFQPQLTTEPTAPGEDVMCQNNLRTGDDFIIVDYKPTESLKADDNFLVDPSDPSVDPNNPNVDLTPGPDDNVSLPGLPMAEAALPGLPMTDQWPIGPIPSLDPETLNIVHEGYWL